MNLKKLKYFAVILMTSIQILGVASISASQFPVGDVNGDNTVNSTDYALMKRFLLKIVDDFPVQDNIWAVDTNGRRINIPYKELNRFCICYL